MTGLCRVCIDLGFSGLFCCCLSVGLFFVWLLGAGGVCLFLMNSQEKTNLRIILDSEECNVYPLCGFILRNMTDNL